MRMLGVATGRLGAGANGSIWREGTAGVEGVVENGEGVARGAWACKTGAGAAGALGVVDIPPNKAAASFSRSETSLGTGGWTGAAGAMGTGASHGAEDEAAL